MINCIHQLRREANGALRWRQTVRACQVPASIAVTRTPNRNTPHAPSPLSLELDTSAFNQILSGQDQSIQTAIDKLDDHHHHETHVLGMSPAATIPAGSTRYLTPYESALLLAAPNWPWPVESTLITLKVTTTTAQPASGSLVVDAYVAGAGTALAVAIAAGSPAGTYSNTVNSVDIAENATLAIRLINNAAGVSASVAAVSLITRNPAID